MSLGPRVRRLFGPYERQISEAYRAIYIDIDEFVSLILRWAPRAARILEVGCGEGAVTTRLVPAYPDARITAIDITPRIGRLYRGPADRVEFIRAGAGQVAALSPGAYDLVILSDVLHHVPFALRQGVIESIRSALAPGGSFVFKDWERTRTPIHWLCHASDRWLTGDRVEYMSRDQMRARLAGTFGAAALIEEARVRPWGNNLATLVRTVGD